jgi:hypothetical protein
MGVVFEAEYLDRNERVAVKTMQYCDGVTLLRFKNEFRHFADVVHPNLVALHELLESNGNWFLVMELLAGTNFSKALRGEATDDPVTETADQGLATERTMTLRMEEVPVSFGRATPVPVAPLLAVPDSPKLRDAFAQLALAIDAIHSAGQLHRDIKPANVFIEPDGRVVLLDFGVALAMHQSRRSQVESSDVVVGTPRFVAPELLRGDLPSPASDWYAFGVMLHDLISGVQAFSGQVSEVVWQKLNTVLPPVRERFPFVNPQLAELIDSLLSVDPASRPTFHDILRVLGHELPKAQQRARPSLQLGLVGRKEEQAAIREAARTARLAPAALVLRGRSGVGKSALLGQVLQSLEDDGAIVLSGRCYEHESVPFKSVDRIVDSLAGVLEREPKLREPLRPPDVAEFVRAFPVLREAWAHEDGAAVAPDWTAVRRRALNALADVLKRLAARSRLVCCVDDLQWGDSESVAVLAKLTEPGGPPGLVIAAFREEESENAAVQSYLRAVAHQEPPPVTVRLEALSEADCRTLAERVATEAGVTDAHVIDWARVQSGGEPYFLHELLFYAAGADAPAELKGLTLRDVLKKRAERLTPETIGVLRAIALSVSGVPVAIVEAAAQVAQVAQARRVLGQLRAAHLIRSQVDGGIESVDTFHDKVREVVSSACTAEEASQVHAALFSAWRGSTIAGNARMLAMAHHGLRAGAGVSAGESRDTDRRSANRRRHLQPSRGAQAAVRAAVAVDRRPAPGV